MTNTLKVRISGTITACWRRGVSRIARSDRTTIDIILLLFGAGGILVAVTGAGAPEANFTYWGSNPFALKQDIIDGVHAKVFAGAALLAVILELVSQITGWPKEERRKSTRFYSMVMVATIVSLVLVFSILAAFATWLARRQWQPEVIGQMREAYEQARFIVKHDGWRPDQFVERGKLSGPEFYRKANVDSAQKSITQIEALLDLPHATADLPSRVARVGWYFGSR